MEKNTSLLEKNLSLANYEGWKKYPKGDPDKLYRGVESTFISDLMYDISLDMLYPIWQKICQNTHHNPFFVAVEVAISRGWAVSAVFEAIYKYVEYENSTSTEGS